MKSQPEDIIQELKSLDSSFLLENKKRKIDDNDSMELSEDFFRNVMKNLPSQESKTISIAPIKKIKIFQIAASIVLILSVSILTYTFIIPSNSVIESGKNLEQLVSQTSTQEIDDYLNEYGMPADEEFLTNYLNNTIDITNIN
jgi:superfamily II helicase